MIKTPTLSFTPQALFQISMFHSLSVLHSWENPQPFVGDFNSRFTFVNFLFVKSKSLTHPPFMNETYKFNLEWSPHHINI